MNKVEQFKEEIEFIKNISIKEFAKNALEHLPAYFFVIPASSTGKYHPSYATGNGGLVRHVKACMRIATELFQLEMFNYFSEDEKDLILVSLLLHDGYKHGEPTGDNKEQFATYSKAEHPVIMANILKQEGSVWGEIGSDNVEIIASNIATHMGQWNYDYKTKRIIMEKPHSKMQNFVHLVDYLASRKMLEVNFTIIPERK
jgi:hypothetical protein